MLVPWGGPHKRGAAPPSVFVPPFFFVRAKQVKLSTCGVEARRRLARRAVFEENV
jgi:hypothetical protein